VKVVGQSFEHALAWIGDGEEALERPLRQPSELRAGFEQLADRRPGAAERDELDPFAPGLEQTDCGRRRFLDQRPRLLFPAAAKAIRRRPAFLVPALDEARADLCGHDSVAVEDSNCVAAEANQQGGDAVVGVQLREQRRQVHRVVLRLVREPKGWSDDHGLLRQLDPGPSTGIDRPALLAFEPGQPLAHVLAPDEASHALRLGVPARREALRTALRTLGQAAESLELLERQASATWTTRSAWFTRSRSSMPDGSAKQCRFCSRRSRRTSRATSGRW